MIKGTNEMTTRKYSLTVLSIFMAFSVSACGGASTGGGQNSFNSLRDSGQAMLQSVSSLSPTQTTPTSASGTAIYAGYAAFRDTPDTPSGTFSNADVVSNIGLQANLVTGTFSGSLTNFEYPDADLVSGTVAITGGQVLGNTISANVAGSTLVDGVNVRISGNLEGSVYGASADAVGGTINGSTNTAATGNSPFFGIFVATKR